jgi:hypothetical protein
MFIFPRVEKNKFILAAVLGTGVEQIRTRAECPRFYTCVLN